MPLYKISYTGKDGEPASVILKASTLKRAGDYFVSKNPKAEGVVVEYARYTLAPHGTIDSDIADSAIDVPD